MNINHHFARYEKLQAQIY